MRIRVDRDKVFDAVAFGTLVIAPLALLGAVMVASGRTVEARNAQAQATVLDCPYGAGRVTRASSFICLSAGDVEAIAEDCYKGGQACIVESPEAHAAHGDEAPGCVLEDLSGTWMTTRQMSEGR